MILLVACVAVTALKFAVIALALAVIITVLWGAYAHPGELFGTLAFFFAINLLTTHTVACLTLIGFLGFWLIVRRPQAQQAAPIPAEQLKSPAPDDRAGETGNLEL